MEVGFGGGIAGLGAVLNRPLRSIEKTVAPPSISAYPPDVFVRTPRASAEKLSEQALQAKPDVFEYRTLNPAFAKAFMQTRLL